MGGRGGRRLRHRRDVLLAGRSAAGHCSHQGGGAPRRRDADRAPPRQRARGDLAGRGVQAARGRRRRRGRAELRARAGNHAAVARGGAPGGHRPRGGPAGPLSHDGEPPDLPLARGSRGTGPAIAARPFPTALDPFTCSRYEIAEFARRAQDIGVSYLGVCCGAAPHHVRSMAEALGRTPPASRYTADMSKHYALGTDPTLRAENQEYAERM